MYCKVYANVSLDYTSMQRLVPVLNTGLVQTSVVEGNGQTALKARCPQRTLIETFNASQDPFITLGMITMLVHPRPTRIALQFMVCEMLAAEAILGASFCNQQKLAPKMSGDACKVKVG